MSLPSKPVFEFDEADHLTRIHLKLGLEDLGFPVREDNNTIIIDAAPAPPLPLRRPIEPPPTKDEQD